MEAAAAAEGLGRESCSFGLFSIKPALPHCRTWAVRGGAAATPPPLKQRPQLPSPEREQPHEHTGQHAGQAKLAPQGRRGQAGPPPAPLGEARQPPKGKSLSSSPSCLFQLRHSLVGLLTRPRWLTVPGPGPAPAPRSGRSSGSASLQGRKEQGVVREMQRPLEAAGPALRGDQEPAGVGSSPPIPLFHISQKPRLGSTKEGAQATLTGLPVPA